MLKAAHFLWSKKKKKNSGEGGQDPVKNERGKKRDEGNMLSTRDRPITPNEYGKGRGRGGQ